MPLRGAKRKPETESRVDKRQYILGKLFGDFILDIVAVVF